MYKILSKFERDTLIHHHRIEKSGEVKDRLKVVLWYDDGKTHEEIARLLFIDITTSIRHLDDYSKGKTNKNSGGSDSKLTLKQSEELIGLIKDKLYTNVFEIINICKIKFNIEYTRTGMTDWLNRNGFAYMKANEVLPGIDVEKQIEYIKTYDKLKKETILNNEVLLHVDSCHSSMNLKLSKAWIHKDNKIFLKKNNAYTRVNITGALNLSNMDLITDNYKVVNGENFIKFLEKLRVKYSNKKINIVLDNGRYHKTSEVLSFCKENNINLCFLPAYSPNLNPIERVWKVMNRYVRNNIIYERPKDFQNKILEFFNKTWNNIKYKLKTEVNDNFHILSPT